jgi:formylglycine-generating enzyme required for sulfatase activity
MHGLFFYLRKGIAMKKLFAVLAALILLGVMTSCGGGGDSSTGTSDSTLTAKQIEEIEASSRSITNKLSTAVDPSSEEALTDAKAHALTFPNVESADVINGNLVVKYKGAGQEIWIKNTQGDAIPEERSELRASVSKSALGQIRVFKSPVGNRRAVLINALSEDPSRSYDKKKFDEIESILWGIGFVEVRRLNGPDANLENLADLSKYSVVVLNTHASPSTEGVHVTATGEEWYANDWNKKCYAVNGAIAKFDIPWGGTFGTKAVVGITGKFWKTAYSSSNFTRTLFLDGSCYGHSNDLFRQDLQSIGIAAYAGWTLESNKVIAVDVNYGIINYMAQGKTLQEAYDLLPDDYKQYSYKESWWDIFPTVTSSLWIGPNNETSITLKTSDTTITSTSTSTSTTSTTIASTNYTSPNIGTLKYVPAGSFQRDATSTNISTVSAFRMSEYEITRSQFLAIMGTDPSDSTRSTGSSDPVQKANWYHAIAFCNKLSIAEGLNPVYSVSGVNFSTLTYAEIPTSNNATWNATTANWSANGYRLPTEMEWMWAAMGATSGYGYTSGTYTSGYTKAFAGSTGSNSMGDYAWTWENRSVDYKSHPVGTKYANELGLYDMSGNVWEYCWDWYDSYPTGTQTNYRGAASGTTRVYRGGAWDCDASEATVAFRYGYIPSHPCNGIGFRVVRQ